ncbi:DUF1963 domain-containing protein [Patulibacter defluvii]|uniref:DUF1963 domain-containing protein n=1 Tax=Patulibacter defluvii TaxID=3095358 RepID=UPI002A75A7AD|nr:DUF1963 domain-containing protein [Patulibacter sp. DM4]
MLSPAEVHEIALRHLPEERVDEALAAVRPGWRARLQDGGPLRIGGPAPLAEDEPWPRNPRGIPLTFLAAIDCAALPALDDAWPDPTGWRHDGALLRIFADLVDQPREPGPATILVAPEGTPTREVDPPPLPDPWPAAGDERDDLAPHERVRALPAHQAGLRPFLTADEDAFGPLDVLDPDPDVDGYRHFRFDLRLDGEELDWDDPRIRPFTVSHVSGAPCSVDEDVRLRACEVREDQDGPHQEQDWRVLLALHDGFGGDVEILDGGAYHVLVPVDDLAEGRYERAVCDVTAG